MRQKLLVIIALITICFNNSYSQSDWWGTTYENKEQYKTTYYDRYRNTTYYIRLSGIYINMRTKETLLEVEAYKVGTFNGIHLPVSIWAELNITKGARSVDDLRIISVLGKPIKDYAGSNFGIFANDYEKKTIGLIFNGILPLNATSFNIYENSSSTESFPKFQNLQWNSISDDLIQKYYGFKFRTDWTEETVKQFADTHNDGICGIYVQQFHPNFIIGCIKEDNTYKLIYLGCDNSANRERYSYWHVGNLIAVLHPKYASTNEFDAEMLNTTMSLIKGVKFTYRPLSGEILNDFSPTTNVCYNLNKVYPAASGSIISGGNNKNNNAGSNSPDNFAGGWSGSGFALNKGYLATNYHVIEGASVIKVFGVKGNFNIGYNAQVVITDKVNDLAVLKINDNRFQGFGAIPYHVKTSMAEVGESVFVLGYPLTTTMGSEVKLTTGVISARSGFQGDVSLYQVSAPIQPGNSGGPCFDNNGNLVGIINSKHRGAENVSYAIKSSYLQNLVESSDVTGLLPQSNTISSYSLQAKVKSVKNFVYYIRCK